MISDSSLNTLKTTIRKKLVKLKITTGIVTPEVSLSDSDYRQLKTEAERLEISESKLRGLIEEVRDTITLKPKEEIKYKILLKEIPLGQHVRINTKDDKGEAIEELVFIGENRFFLIHHERGSLKINDELKAITFPWEVGGFIDFEVFRDGKRISHGEDLTIYRTRPIKEIVFLHPQFDYEQLVSSDE